MRHAFKPGSDERGGGGGRAPDRARGDANAGSARAYWCAACLTRITDEDAAIAVAGDHRHAFVNPAGVAFEIGCFCEARCAVEGEPTLEHTWFAGRAWSYAVCANCRAHLGWCYEGEGARFYGLIVARLIGPM